MTPEHSNFKAGLFVLVGLVLIVATTVMLSDLDGLFTPTRQVTVRFPLSDGLQGLKVGASVTIGDHPAGQVVAIEDVFAPDQPNVIVAKDARFTVPAAYTLFDNAQVELVVPPLGAGTKLNVRSFGHDAGEAKQDQAGIARKGETWVYQDGEVIQGGIAGSALTENFVKDLGIEDRQRLEIQGIIADVKTITGALAAKPDSIQNIVANLEAASATLKRDLPVISGNLKQTSEDLKVVVGDVQGRYKQWLDQLDSITNRADTALAAINGMLEENRPVLKSTLAKADDIAGEVQSEWMPRVSALLEDGAAATTNIRESTAQLRAFISAQLPVIERALANLRLTSDQLKLTSIEVRRAPWRLLYEPSDKELETDNLYDAARSFALAAGALESTSTSLNAVLKQYGERLSKDDPNLKLMLENLQQTFRKFSEAEDKFWNAVGEQPAK